VPEIEEVTAETWPADLFIDIDRSSPVPLYFQLATRLEQAIDDGTLKPGTRFENELVLGNRVGLSRPTVRRAVDELVSKGLLVRRRGVGTRVVRRPPIREVEPSGPHVGIEQGPRLPATRQPSREAVSADAPQVPSEGRSGSPTMADIAARLGVSRQLVSLVLRDLPGASDETRRRVREAARELGFTPHVAAQSLRQARSTHLGVVFAPTHLVELEIVEAMYPAAAAHNYDLILSAQTPMRSTEDAVEELIGHRCAAIVIIGSSLKDAPLRELVERCPVPVVVIGGRQRPSGSQDVVRSAGDVGIADAVHHLASLGHRRLTYIHTASMPSGPLRLTGFRRGVKQAGMEADVVRMAEDYIEETGAVAAQTLLRRDELPTGIVAANDQVALGMLMVLSRHGIRVPQDVSLTGFDDTMLARLSSVDLTTVNQDPAQMGSTAVSAALRRLRTPECGPAEHVVPTTLVVRGSTAGPRSTAEGSGAA
jgi:DNA-binding LacI/PurR family transcriptional regulator